MSQAANGNLFKLWGKLVSVGTIATVLAIRYLDGPVANFCIRRIDLSAAKNYAPNSPFIAACLAAGIPLFGVLLLLTRRHARAAKALLLSSGSALASLYATERLLKPLFSRPYPHYYVYQLRTHFGWHSGDFRLSAFPSTHAAIAVAAVTVLSLYFPQFWIAGAVAVLVTDVLLVLGGWHFISDVIAGNLIGFSLTLIIFKAVSALQTWGRSRIGDSND